MRARATLATLALMLVLTACTSNGTCTIASVTWVYQEECTQVGKGEDCQPVLIPIYVYNCTTPTPEHNPKAEETGR